MNNPIVCTLLGAVLCMSTSFAHAYSFIELDQDRYALGSTARVAVRGTIAGEVDFQRMLTVTNPAGHRTEIPVRAGQEHVELRLEREGLYELEVTDITGVVSKSSLLVPWERAPGTLPGYRDSDTPHLLVDIKGPTTAAANDVDSLRLQARILNKVTPEIDVVVLLSGPGLNFRDSAGNETDAQIVIPAGTLSAESLVTAPRAGEYIVEVLQPITGAYTLHQPPQSLSLAFTPHIESVTVLTNPRRPVWLSHFDVIVKLEGIATEELTGITHVDVLPLKNRLDPVATGQALTIAIPPGLDQGRLALRSPEPSALQVLAMVRGHKSHGTSSEVQPAWPWKLALGMLAGAAIGMLLRRRNAGNPAANTAAVDFVVGISSTAVIVAVSYVMPADALAMQGYREPYLQAFVLGVLGGWFGPKALEGLLRKVIRAD